MQVLGGLWDGEVSWVSASLPYSDISCFLWLISLHPCLAGEGPRVWNMSISSSEGAKAERIAMTPPSPDFLQRPPNCRTLWHFLSISPCQTRLPLSQPYSIDFQALCALK